MAIYDSAFRLLHVRFNFLLLFVAALAPNPPGWGFKGWGFKALTRNSGTAGTIFWVSHAAGAGYGYPTISTI